MIGSTSLPNASRNSASKVGRSMRSASILFTTNIRHSLRSPAQAIMRRVVSSMPFCALTTTSAVSTAASAGRAWPMKSG
ncbi:hypothetical protein D3C78_1646340 [compost metagenome]